MILQGVKFSIFLLIFEWTLQQCAACDLRTNDKLHQKWVWSDTIFTKFFILIFSMVYDAYTSCVGVG